MIDVLIPNHDPRRRALGYACRRHDDTIVQSHQNDGGQCGVAEVRAFRGVRYAGKLRPKIGSLIAPPYDVTYPHLIARLRDRHPFNMVHLEHVEPDPGDSPHDRAAALYRQWIAAGLLARDTAPSLYRYEHGFTIEGRRQTRAGILAAVRLAAWRDGVVLPHEATFPGPRAERLRRLRTVQANLSPLYFLLQDDSGDLRELLATVGEQSPDVEGYDAEGDVHRLTVVDEPAAIRRVSELFRHQRLYVADGHHRYEAALAYRDECRADAGEPIDPGPDGPGAQEYVLALICAAEDPGVMILPTHRLVRHVTMMDPARLWNQLAQCFAVESIGIADDQAMVALLADPDTVCLARVASVDGLWRIRSHPDRRHVALMPDERDPSWRNLNMAILGSAILEGILGITRDQFPDHVAYAHETHEALDAVANGDAQAAFLVRANTVEELTSVADAGETMPPKSTFFWPKVPAGLVIHDLT
jgi:uncharacterized protein (DUF1015 family)